MNIENFSSFLENPSQLYQLPYQELKSLVLQYPFSANLRLLLLQKSKMENHREYEHNLKMAATFSIDRAHLKQQINRLDALTESKDNVLMQEDFLELKDLSALHKEPEKELIEVNLDEKGEKPKDNISINIPNDSGDITTEQEEDVFGNLVSDDNPETKTKEDDFLLEELLNTEKQEQGIVAEELLDEESQVLEWEVQEGGQAEDANPVMSESEQIPTLGENGNSLDDKSDINTIDEENFEDNQEMISDVIEAHSVIDEIANDLSAPKMEVNSKIVDLDDLENNQEFDELDMIEDLENKLNGSKSDEESNGHHFAETPLNWVDEDNLENEIAELDHSNEVVPGSNKLENSTNVLAPTDNEDIISDEDELEMDYFFGESDEELSDEDELEDEVTDEELSSMNLINTILEEDEANFPVSEEPVVEKEDIFPENAQIKSFQQPFVETENKEELDAEITQNELIEPEIVADDIEEILLENISNKEIHQENANLSDSSDLASDLNLELIYDEEEESDNLKHTSNILEDALSLPVLPIEEDEIELDITDEDEWDDEIPHPKTVEVETDTPKPVAKKAFSSWSVHQKEEKKKEKAKKKKKAIKKKEKKLAKAKKIKKKAKAKAKAQRLAYEAKLKKEAEELAQIQRLEEDAKMMAEVKTKKGKKKKEEKLVETKKVKKVKPIKKAQKPTTAKTKKKEKKKKKKDPIVAFANLSIEQSNEVISETFAKILTMQGEYEEAIKMYEHLKLNIPEKSSYFAKKIKNIKKEL